MPHSWMRGGLLCGSGGTRDAKVIEESCHSASDRGVAAHARFSSSQAHKTRVSASRATFLERRPFAGEGRGRRCGKPVQHLLAAADRPYADTALFARILLRMLGHLDGYVHVKFVCYDPSPSKNRGLDQSRRCPLCAQGIGEYLIHNIRSKYDYTKYFLPPLRSNSPVPAIAGPSPLNQRRRTRREWRWGQRERREQEVQDQLERSIERRKWVYRHHLYAKVSVRWATHSILELFIDHYS